MTLYEKDPAVIDDDKLDFNKTPSTDAVDSEHLPQSIRHHAKNT